MLDDTNYQRIPVRFSNKDYCSNSVLLLDLRVKLPLGQLKNDPLKQPYNVIPAIYACYSLV